MPTKLLRKAMVAFFLATLIGCSSGGGETGTGLDDRTTVGVISGFGSVFVNGVKYETTDTIIEIDEVAALESELSVGMLISLKGRVNVDGLTGTATTISAERSVVGVVLENNILTSNSLDVMGQIVVVDNDTIFESKESSIISMADIVATDTANNIPGSIIEVSGYTSGDGTIYATRILLKKLMYTLGEEIKVHGVVSNVTDTQFQVGKQTFSYTDQVLENFGSVIFSDNNVVSVKTEGDVDENNNYIATQVKLKNSGASSVPRVTGEEVEIEGYINHSIDLVSNIFSVNGHQVKVDALKTKFESGNSAALLKGVKVEIEGIAAAGNIIIADEIEIKQESNRRFEDVITEIDENRKSITVAGQVVLITNTTRMKDDRDDRRFFKFEDLTIGDLVEISAYQMGDNQFVATRLERDDLETSNDNYEWELEGEVTEINPLTIDGQVVELSNNNMMIAVGDKLEAKGVITDNGTWQVTEIYKRNEWEIDDGVITSIDLENDLIMIDGIYEIDISRIIFNASLQDIVEIEGIEIDGVRVATEMEIEDDEDHDESEDDDHDDSDDDDD